MVLRLFRTVYQDIHIQATMCTSHTGQCLEVIALFVLENKKIRGEVRSLWGIHILCIVEMKRS